MKITTSKGKTHEIDWIFENKTNGNSLVMQLRDDRSMSEIVSDFDGCENIHQDIGNGLDFEGYTEISTINRSAYSQSNIVYLTLYKPEK